MKSRSFVVPAVLLSLCAAASLWWALRESGSSVRKLSADQVGRFFTGVSSLDVEENERAHRLFGELSDEIPTEPAVWANLGLAGLRLGDSVQAGDALNRAEALQPNDPRILELQAILDERQGRFAQAIERLRFHPNPDVTVLYRLSELLERTGRPEDAAEQLDVLDRIQEREPGNVVVAFGRARLLARTGDASALSAVIEQLAENAVTADPATREYLDTARQAVADGDLRVAGTQLAFLQNLNRPTEAYRADLAALGADGGSIGQPLRTFLRYAEPDMRLAEADVAIHFHEAPVSDFETPIDELMSVLIDVDQAPQWIAVSGGTVLMGDRQVLTYSDDINAPERLFVLPIDLNGDFRLDLAVTGPAGLKLWMQEENGTFTGRTLPDGLQSVLAAPGTGVWGIDFENDGDLDVLLGRADGPPRLLRNNGDGGFDVLEPFETFPIVTAVEWADFDGDGDGDLALLDGDRRAMISWNNRSGLFTAPQPIGNVENVAAIAVGDAVGKGSMQLLALDQSGAVHAGSFEPTESEWVLEQVTVWGDAPDLLAATNQGRVDVQLADLDNNGGVDLVCSASDVSSIWLNHGESGFQRLEAAPAMQVGSIADTDEDGRLDLVGVRDGVGLVARTEGTKDYRWQSIQTRTLANIADGRINSFGIGGRIEIRAGTLLAVAPITSPRTHFGLGEQQGAGVARIVWPNGVAQVEFDLEANQGITAIQRLKGSCPWVFTEVDGEFQFLKDFIWRSPLGMRINSQDTAGVDQTEDWILISGDRLRAGTNGYEIRVTAELWETHFFDHVSLMTVDHPASFSVRVDERFVPTAPPRLQVQATTEIRPLEKAHDESGRDVRDQIAVADGRYVSDFALGQYQGVAEDHWIEFELPTELPAEQEVVLVGNGWIYPTDSSLNVAISQGTLPKPSGLMLEAHDSLKGWKAVSGDLGFPAGKNKTVVIPVPRETLDAGQRRFRLRTNLEIYWDQVGWAVALPNAEMVTSTAETRVARLEHRGFSRLKPIDRRLPDTPIYGELSGIGPIWRDLEGYYTRHGDVAELLAATDDRYVIMNAGDELILRFDPPPPPPPGWVRDFVLVGDGWVKDGDFNTVASRTVGPLPSHDVKRYREDPVSLADDPVFQRNPGDWERYHTRYVRPTSFELGLMSGARTQPFSLEATP